MISGITAGISVITYTDSNGCQKTATVTVNENPGVPSVTYNPPACDETTFSITLSGLVIGAKYTVKEQNGSAIGSLSPSSPYTATNSGPVTFTNIRVGAGYQGTVSINGCGTAPTICPPPAPPLVQKVAPQTKVTNEETIKAGFDAYPVPFKDQLTIKYKFDYVSDVKIEVFNAHGIRVLSKTDTNGYLSKEIVLDLKMNSGRQQVYVVKVTTNQGSSTKKAISSQ